MTSYELIDMLCGVTDVLIGIIREQQLIVEQADIPDETKENMRKKKDVAEMEMNIIECPMRF